MKLTDLHAYVNSFDACDGKKDEVRALLKEIERKATNLYYSSASSGENGMLITARNLDTLARKLAEINDSLGVDGDDNTPVVR